MLFEAISLLPEYGLTRAEERILRRYSREIVRHVPKPAMVSELGSGSGRKTRWILSALCEREPLSYHYPIEITAPRWRRAESELKDIEHISILGVEREYLDGLREVVSLRPHGTHLLVLFLGSIDRAISIPARTRVFCVRCEAFCCLGDFDRCWEPI